MCGERVHADENMRLSFFFSVEKIIDIPLKIGVCSFSSQWIICSLAYAMLPFPLRALIIIIMYIIEIIIICWSLNCCWFTLWECADGLGMVDIWRDANRLYLFIIIFVESEKKARGKWINSIARCITRLKKKGNANSLFESREGERKRPEKKCWMQF